LAVTILATAAVVMGAGPASAESYYTYCYTRGTNYENCISTDVDHVSATASYHDASNDVCAEDGLRDGHSAVVAYWKKGHPNNWSRVWAYGGVGTKGCGDLTHLTENAEYVIQACVGEWDTVPANRDVLDCGATQGIRL
jgi:hypothetical protein